MTRFFMFSGSTKRNIRITTSQAAIVARTSQPYLFFLSALSPPSQEARSTQKRPDSDQVAFLPPKLIYDKQPAPHQLSSKQLPGAARASRPRHRRHRRPEERSRCFF